MKERLYGWAAPRSLGRRSALGLMILFLVVSLMSTQAVMTFLWGPPQADPMISHGLSRLVLLSLATIAAAWLFRSSTRSLLVPVILVLLVSGAMPVYSPHHVLFTTARVLRDPDLMWDLCSAYAVGGFLGLILVRGILARTSEGISFAKGSTQWGSAHAFKTPTQGLLMGKMGTDYLRYDGDGHLITIAATRSGKGVGTVMPNLLNYPGSILVTDPKGENYAVTSAWRKDYLGHRIVALDPFHLMVNSTSSLSALNPMDFVDLSGNDYVETAMMLADMIVGRGHQVEESHWRMEAKGLLFSFILYVAESEHFQQERHLIKVRSLLTQDREGLEKTLEAMKKSDLLQVKEGACRIEQKSDRERSGVFSTAQSHTHFLSSPRMHHVLTETNCDLEDLRKGRMTVYVILPREYLSAFAPWMRLMITSCYYACTYQAAKKPRPEHRIVFLLDEFANLGYMQNIKEAVSLGGGYGVTMWLILQDLAQLKREYRSEWESFLANCDVIQAFAIQDPFTGQRISQLLGEMSIWQRRLNKSSPYKFERMHRGYEESSRPLLKPDELRRLHPARQLLFMRPYQPVVANKLIYYKDPLTSPRAQPNPFVES